MAKQAEPGTDAPGVLVRPPLLYLAALGLGFGLDGGWPAAVLPGSVQYVLGGALVVLGLATAALAIRRFVAAGTHVQTQKPSTTVVTDGPYRFSRNPIYLGLTGITAGIGIAADSPWVLLMLVPALAVMRYGVIAREERYLERKFGEDYRRYKARVRRWL